MFTLSNYRRAIMCRRAVRVKSQLTSHKRFANAFLTYCQLVDNARLYSTNALEGPPKVNQLLLLHILFVSAWLRLLIWCESSIACHTFLQSSITGTQNCYGIPMKLQMFVQFPPKSQG